MCWSVGNWGLEIKGLALQLASHTINFWNVWFPGGMLDEGRALRAGHP